jgi:hypothetical protein
LIRSQFETTLSYLTHNQTSNQQKDVIKNVEANLTKQGKKKTPLETKIW